jgi:hypothetical protein
MSKMLAQQQYTKPPVQEKTLPLIINTFLLPFLYLPAGRLVIIPSIKFLKLAVFTIINKYQSF